MQFFSNGKAALVFDKGQDQLRIKLASYHLDAGILFEYIHVVSWNNV